MPGLSEREMGTGPAPTSDLTRTTAGSPSPTETSPDTPTDKDP